MSDNNMEEQMSGEEKEITNGNIKLLHEQLKNSSLSKMPVAAYDIEYVPHKAEGLQSASDMWIDKKRLVDILSKDKVILGKREDIQD